MKVPERHRDKSFLIALAQESHEFLQKRHLGGPFRLASKVRIRSTSTNGWAATIGRYGKFYTAAEVWLDSFTGHATRKVYYALAASQPDGLSKLVRTARREFGPHLSIYQKDWDEEADYIRLFKKLAKARFGHPVYERYKSSKEYFYGVYEFDRAGLQRNEFRRLAERVADFFQTISDAFSADERAKDYESYQTVENRRSVSRHIRRERKSHAATLRKQIDNYICKVCGFDYSRTYGRLGEDFAEAHHIIPLSKNNSRRSTTVEDLITVCANCHRMLHRLPGTHEDIAQLRRLVTAHRKHGQQGGGGYGSPAAGSLSPHR